MIALGVGKHAVCYNEKEGTTWGEELMDVYFGEDLGFDSKFLLSSLIVSWGFKRTVR